MLNRIIPACFQDIHKTIDIAIDISVRVLQRVSDTSLCSQMHNSYWFLVREDLVDSLLVFQVFFIENKIIIPF